MRRLWFAKSLAARIEMDRSERAEFREFRIQNGSGFAVALVNQRLRILQLL
jgi:hypothetical protein